MRPKTLDELKHNWKQRNKPERGTLKLAELDGVELQAIYALARAYLVCPARGHHVSSSQFGLPAEANDTLKRLRVHLFDVEPGKKLPTGAFILPFYRPVPPDELQPEVLEFLRAVKSDLQVVGNML